MNLDFRKSAFLYKLADHFPAPEKAIGSVEYEHFGGSALVDLAQSLHCDS